ncbi:MAG: DUF6458 family protein [Solirubrobacterales bacterium]
MTVGTGIFLIVVGAIIRYALDLKLGGVEEGTIGLILIVAGVVVLVLALISAPFRHFGGRRQETVIEDRRAAPRRTL